MISQPENSAEMTSASTRLRERKIDQKPGSPPASTRTERGAGGASFSGRTVK